MRRFLSIFLIAAALLALAACGSKKEESAGSLYDSIKEKGEVTIGTEGTYAPFTFHDKQGNLTGFDVEIAKEVFKRLDIKPKFIEAKWDGMIAGLDSKRYDMVANEVAIRPERLEKYDMSEPYIVSKAVLIVKEDNNEIKSLKDLKGKKVGQSLDSNYRKIAEENGATNTVVDGFNQSIDLIAAGRIDATINDSLSYLDLKKQRPELPIKKVYEEKEATENAFLFRKDSGKLKEEVDKALAEMKKDGTYLKISEKWFGTDVSK
ncbi:MULTISPECIES: amino acid ABC transporter substrate-binding protein [Bacillaceae]|uniref:Amino acid ABC transporter substrate-binding protein n=1 Tax=Metabacillus flavus TaxID=2823519 RepID=A0ABS5LID5_9BACI|nr:MULTISPECIES: amino acid ABC transporter substrate-binding protein [Bacillaceae]KZZ85785.1 amino acid ABC transporter substrate-binding protein [Bacillus sp. SJS]MBS2970129.1 amino acid ABC transporter substrate-binding protein [Metabacillus flavus]